LDKLKDLPSVPSALDLVNGPDKQILELILIRQEMGRPFALPPGVPADRIAMLRRAFEDTMRDPGFITEAAKLSLEIDPLTGQQISELLVKAYGAPKAIVAEAAKLAK
jgi:tripartite-type tricarboxylate transporter receptor subunit TctC